MIASNQLTVQTQKALQTEGDSMAVKTVCLFPPGRKTLKTNKEKERDNERAGQGPSAGVNR